MLTSHPLPFILVPLGLPPLCARACCGFASERRKRTQLAFRMCEGTTGGWVVEVKPLAAKEKFDHKGHPLG